MIELNGYFGLEKTEEMNYVFKQLYELNRFVNDRAQILKRENAVAQTRKPEKK